VAGATPSKTVKLWRLNKTTFRHIMALTSIRKDKTLRDALKKVKHLELLDDEFINRIADSLDVQQVAKGAVLYKDGDVSDSFYLIEYDGKVQVTPKGGKSEVLGPGDAFGEDAIAQNAPPRTETVKALDKTTVFTMTREALNRVIGNLDDAIQLSQDRRLLKSVPLFRDSDFEGFEFELLAALIERVSFKGGKEIMLEDEMVEAPALYVVYDGILEMECEKYPERERALKKGDFFGDSSLLPDKNSKFGGKGGNKCEILLK
jgi:CRP-like cAMP-binding protein